MYCVSLISSVSAHLTDRKWIMRQQQKQQSIFQALQPTDFWISCPSWMLYTSRGLSIQDYSHQESNKWPQSNDRQRSWLQTNHINLAGNWFSLLDWLKPYKVRLCQYNQISCSFYGAICKLLSHRETMDLKAPIRRILGSCSFKILKKLRNQ